MRKLLLVICILLIVGGCTQDYNDIKPQAKPLGVIVTLDSAQWTPVLIRTADEKLIVYNKGEIKEITLYDGFNAFFVGILIGMVICLFVVAITHTN